MIRVKSQGKIVTIEKTLENTGFILDINSAIEIESPTHMEIDLLRDIIDKEELFLRR